MNQGVQGRAGRRRLFSASPPQAGAQYGHAGTVFTGRRSLSFSEGNEYFREAGGMVSGLGPLESAVMEALWAASSPLSVRGVLDGLPRNEIAYTTVSTVLENLRRKEWVQRERIGRLWYYGPIRDRSTHAADRMREALADSHDSEATLLRFVDGMPPGEARTLRALLAELPEKGEA